MAIIFTTVQMPWMKGTKRIRRTKRVLSHFFPALYPNYLSIYLSMYLSIYLSTYLSIYLSIRIYIYICVCVCHGQNMGWFPVCMGLNIRWMVINPVKGFISSMFGISSWVGWPWSNYCILVYIYTDVWSYINIHCLIYPIIFPQIPVFVFM